MQQVHQRILTWPVGLWSSGPGDPVPRKAGLWYWEEGAEADGSMNMGLPILSRPHTAMQLTSSPHSQAKSLGLFSGEGE